MEGMNCLSSCSLTLVRAKGGNLLDKGVIPAVVEYVLQELCKKLSLPAPRGNSIALLSIRQPASAYDSVCQRLSIPSDNVLDAYSEWYSFRECEKQVGRSADVGKKKVSLGDCDSNAKISAVVAEHMQHMLEKEEVKHKIVVIDGLTELFPGDDIFDEILNLAELVCSSDGAGNEEQSSVGIVAVVGEAQHHTAIVKHAEALNAICDTAVDVSQSATRDGKRSAQRAGDGARRDFARLDIWRRKRSGRVHFERVTGVVQWDASQLRHTETKLGATDSAAADRAAEEDVAHTLAKHGLSFRVSLTSKEREVRAAAALPYLHTDATLADSALQLHPAYLQVAEDGGAAHGRGEVSSDDSSVESEEEEMFSEDV